MKKKFALTLLSLAALTLTSCWDDDEDEDYSTIYPGIDLYNGATYANEYALDGVSIAMRLALLLNEIDAVNAENSSSYEIGAEGEAEIDWSIFQQDLTYDDDEGVSRKELLIGESDDVAIWRSGDIYYINYESSKGYHTQAYADNLYRKGTFKIDTKGVSLEASSDSSPWEVSVDGDTIYYSTTGNASSEYLCKYAQSTKIYYGTYTKADGSQIEGFLYEIDNISPNKTSATTETDWTMEGYITIADWNNVDHILSVDDTYNTRFEIYIYAYGTPVGVPSLTFETIIPYEYRIATTEFEKRNAYIHISIDETTDYYEAKDAYIEFRNDGGVNVEYNGVKYIES